MPSQNAKAQRSKKRYSLIQNNIHRNNTKCKRKRNLIKKCMQLSKLCDQQIVLVIYDKHLGKMYKYSSGEDEFDVKHANDIIETIKSYPTSDVEEADQVQLYSYSNKDILQFSCNDGIDKEDEEMLEAMNKEKQ